MYTRCPGCQAVYELSAALLSEASGVVRCGNCGKTFNTLSHLFADYPEEASEPIRGGGMPPLLEHPELVQAELPVAFEEFDNPAAPDDDEPSQPLPESSTWRAPGMLWPITTAVLAVVLLAQTWLLWQTPGSPLSRWAASGSHEVAVNPNEAIQIISRDLHRHPSLDDAMIISATLRNTEPYSVAFPILEVRFYDASQQLLGARRLNPEEYLHDSHRIDSGMAPGTILPLVMEFVVGSTEPSGFRIRFY
jgi:predicted Zn finger-like uncharacterized protein